MAGELLISGAQPSRYWGADPHEPNPVCDAAPDTRPTLPEAELRACGASEPAAYRHYTCADGAVSVIGREDPDQTWRKVRAAFGEGPHLTPERLAVRLQALSMDHVLATLRAAGVGCAPISNLVTDVRRVQAEQVRPAG